MCKTKIYKQWMQERQQTCIHCEIGTNTKSDPLIPCSRCEQQIHETCYSKRIFGGLTCKIPIGDWPQHILICPGCKQQNIHPAVKEEIREIKMQKALEEQMEYNYKHQEWYSECKEKQHG